ncbi:hypothetical protein J7F03_05875 [Streptomyces sp. ISL-43]|uniref:hypothetical protein n=1 Tax=Streptomyces sp. ISL-43 TaxID=2819183 RepID=UPI001BE7ABE7|nr:hypothetical protein [Streptomyces sp. ISL-43]MBT2446616.1 hypothetical protein [Streptomyces sp. ISL-43]
MGSGEGSYHFGDVVHMNDGTNNTGIVKIQSPTVGAGTPQAPLTPQEAVRQLAVLLDELRAQVAPASAGAIESNLSVITSQESPPEARHSALMAVLGIATLAGEIGRPVADLVTAILGMLGLG